jgi:hypothetical protein
MRTAEIIVVTPDFRQCVGIGIVQVIICVKDRDVVSRVDR